MGKGKISTRDNPQNKAGDAIDKAMAKERLEGIVRVDPLQRRKDEFLEQTRVKTFFEKYPNYGLWELLVLESFGRRSVPLSEINEAMETVGLAARDWLRSHYNKEVPPKEMATILKNLFR